MSRSRLAGAWRAGMRPILGCRRRCGCMPARAASARPASWCAARSIAPPSAGCEAARRPIIAWLSNRLRPMAWNRLSRWKWPKVLSAAPGNRSPNQATARRFWRGSSTCAVRRARKSANNQRRPAKPPMPVSEVVAGWGKSRCAAWPRRNARRCGAPGRRTSCLWPPRCSDEAARNRKITAAGSELRPRQRP